ncbi:Unconventional prefoldin RPB5 interactor [Smittium culicis]|uniref:Unconventional prefoldin RPB5 interactor n=1 Tax=Smittium culicis TaxID=133412 RepID=A0A1R1YSR5_9FUNG|nr:Unconventional prefoldin RPB5 interactor [Smittium culicis]
MSNRSEKDMVINYYKSEIDAQTALLEQSLNYKNEYKSLQKILETFADKTEYDSMIPLGDVAFIPGKIVHTNEILVLLGDDWFVERSAKQAKQIAKRREDFISDSIKKIETQIQSLKVKAGITPLTSEKDSEMFNEEGDPIIEIKEEVDEQEEEKRKIKWERDHTIPETTTMALKNKPNQDTLLSSAKSKNFDNSAKDINDELLDSRSSLNSILGREESELIEMLKNAEITEDGILSDSSLIESDEDIIDFAPVMQNEDEEEPLKFEKLDDDEEYQESIEIANSVDDFNGESINPSISEIANNDSHSSGSIETDEFSDKKIVESLLPKKGILNKTKKPSLFKQKLAARTAPEPSKPESNTSSAVAKKKSVVFDESSNTVATFDNSFPSSSISQSSKPSDSNTVTSIDENYETEFLKPVSTRYFSDIKNTGKKSNAMAVESKNQKKHTSAIMDVVETPLTEPYTEDMADFDILSKEGTVLVDAIPSEENSGVIETHSAIELEGYDEERIPARIKEIPMVIPTKKSSVPDISENVVKVSESVTDSAKPQKISRFKAARLAKLKK